MNSLDKIKENNPTISINEIAQLSLSPIPDLKFISDFHRDMLSISSSTEQQSRSSAIYHVIDNILELKKSTISKEGRLSNGIEFDERLETQAIKHLTNGYSVGDFRKAIDSFYLLKDKNKFINMTPVKDFNYNYHEGLLHILSRAANEQYSQIEVVPHQQGYFPSEIEDIKATHAVYATGRKHKLLSTFTDELSDDDFYKYKEFNLLKRDQARSEKGPASLDEIKLNIIDAGLRDSQRRREINEHFAYNAPLKDYLLLQDTYDFNDSEYKAFKMKFAFSNDKDIKEIISYYENYNSDILKNDSLERVKQDDKPLVIHYNALRLLLEGPDRFEEVDGISHVEKMLKSEINKESNDRYNQSLDSFGEVVERLLNPEFSKDKDQKILDVLTNIYTEKNQSTKRFKI